jgi:hypothetical protein
LAGNLTAAGSLGAVSAAVAEVPMGVAEVGGKLNHRCKDESENI